MNETDIAKNPAGESLASVAAGLANCKGTMTKASQLVAALRRLEISAGHEAILKELEATINRLTNELEKIARVATLPAAAAPGNTLGGLRVLLAEDDDIAAAMTSRMLERNHAAVTRAHDGRAAVAIAAAHDFDLILMDVQMPQLGGLAATRIIRGEQKNNIPIIALTAGKVEDNSSYTEAGMNDAIAKPYKEQKLIETILKCLKTGKSLELIQEALPTKQSLFSLDKLTAMGDQGFVIRMLNLFIEQVPASVTKLKEAYETSDFETVKYLAHRLRPSIRNMGITSAEQEIDQIEALAEAGTKSTEMELLIAKVEQVASEVAQELRKYLEQQ